MPVPRSVTTIGYYRRLARRPNEPVNAFLIREDKTHGDTIIALQRLLREKELTFEDYDMNLDALKNFCGFAQELPCTLDRKTDPNQEMSQMHLHRLKGQSLPRRMSTQPLLAVHGMDVPSLNVVQELVQALRLPRCPLHPRKKPR